MKQLNPLPVLNPSEEKAGLMKEGKIYILPYSKSALLL